MASLRNEFTWSWSRRAVFEHCRRAYYLHYYASWGGWNQRASSHLARESYRLKKLENRWQWSGLIAHDAVAGAIAEAMGGVRPSPGRWVDWAHQVARTEWTTSMGGSRDRKNTRGFWGLVEHEYGDDVRPEEWAETWERTRAAVASFCESDWPDLVISASADVGNVLVFDDGDFDASLVSLGGLRVFAMPDLMLSPSGGDGPVLVVDWKTGKPRPEHAGQVALYAAAAAVRFGGWPAKGFSSAVVYLSSRPLVERRDISETDAYQAVEAARASAEEMLAMLDDRTGNKPAPMEDFTKTTDLRECARCAFRSICGR